MSDEFGESWEEQLYEAHEYSEEDRYLYEEGSGEGPGFREQPESPGYGIDPSDWGRIGFGGRRAGMADPLGEKGKRLRDPRSVSLDQMRGALNDGAYRDIHESTKDEAFAFVERIPEKEMILYNVDILTAAALFRVLYNHKGGVNRDNITSFLKETGGLDRINHLDFVRYIRKLA